MRRLNEVPENYFRFLVHVEATALPDAHRRLIESQTEIDPVEGFLRVNLEIPLAYATQDTQQWLQSNAAIALLSQRLSAYLASLPSQN